MQALLGTALATSLVFRRESSLDAVSVWKSASASLEPYGVGTKSTVCVAE